MGSASAFSFKWLDILEKEFDKAFVNVELLLNDFDIDECDELQIFRKNLSTMCSCFSQLSHKALTIFQLNCKAEAEIVNLKSEVIELNTKNKVFEKDINSLLVQLHSDQLEQGVLECDEKENIKDKLNKELANYSPIRLTCGNYEKTIINLQNWKHQLQIENALLRTTIVNLQAEICGTRLAARYLDKELAGRMQQLQLLTFDDMDSSMKNKLWEQLNTEILLQRHKTVIKVMKQQNTYISPPENIAGSIRNVHLVREPTKGLGIAVTGGKEHGVPVIISELDSSLDSKQLFVGDAILSVNGIDLNQLTHSEAVKILSKQFGNVILSVISLSTIDTNEIEERTQSYLCYPFVDNRDNHSEAQNVLSVDTPKKSKSPCGEDIPSNGKNDTSSISEKQLSEFITTEENPNDVYGITTLQNIFKNVSSIKSTHECSSFKHDSTHKLTNTIKFPSIPSQSHTKKNISLDEFHYTNHSSLKVENNPLIEVHHSTTDNKYGNSSIGTPV